MAEAGLLDPGFVAAGPFGIALLRPRALFGLEGLDPVAHAVLWSLAANTALLAIGSLLVPGRLSLGAASKAALSSTPTRTAAGAGRPAPRPPLWRGERGRPPCASCSLASRPRPGRDRLRA
jgi:hypothetical protein